MIAAMHTPVRNEVNNKSYVQDTLCGYSEWFTTFRNLISPQYQVSRPLGISGDRAFSANNGLSFNV